MFEEISYISPLETAVIKVDPAARGRAPPLT